MAGRQKKAGPVPAAGDSALRGSLTLAGPSISPFPARPQQLVAVGAGKALWLWLMA